MMNIEKRKVQKPRKYVVFGLFLIQAIDGARSLPTLTNTDKKEVFERTFATLTTMLTTVQQD